MKKIFSHQNFWYCIPEKEIYSTRRILIEDTRIDSYAVWDIPQHVMHSKLYKLVSDNKIIGKFDVIFISKHAAKKMSENYRISIEHSIFILANIFFNFSDIFTHTEECDDPFIRTIYSFKMYCGILEKVYPYISLQQLIERYYTMDMYIKKEIFAYYLKEPNFIFNIFNIN